jgi:hypothetical protein
MASTVGNAVFLLTGGSAMINNVISGYCMGGMSFAKDKALMGWRTSCAG